MLRKISIWIVVLLSLIGSAYIFYGQMFPSGAWRYKITVNIETPEGSKSGSVVREIRAKPNFAKFLNPDVGNVTYELLGEAVVIDIGKHRKLFGLINEHSYQDVFNAFPIPKGEHVDLLKYYSQLDAGAESELKKDLPSFVTFTDLNNPASIKGAGIKVMSDVFGEGVSLRNITIEMTHDPITWGIEGDLPWLPARKNIPGYIGGSSVYPYKDPTETYVRGSNFSKGKFW